MLNNVLTKITFLLFIFSFAISSPKAQEKSNCSLSPAMIDNFGVLNHETEMARLDTSVHTILSAPEFDAYVVIYGGKINQYGEVAERLNRVKNYLLNLKKLDPTRIFFITGGFREKFEFELWLSPVKNSYPPLSPSIEVEKVIFRGKMKPLSVNF